MNSIIEAQITLKEEINKEIERCKNPLYYYENYCHIEEKKVLRRDLNSYYESIIINRPKTILT